MIEKIIYGIGIAVLIIVSFGAIKYIETQMTLSIMEKATEEAKKVMKPIKTEKRRRWTNKRVWIEGRTLKECMRINKELNNNTVKCRNGYYKKIRVFR